MKDGTGGDDEVVRDEVRAAAPGFAVLVIDDHGERRGALIARLAGRGMRPLAPRTPLDAIALLTRAPLDVGLCLLATGFGVSSSRELAAVLADSFPWLATAEITDDLDVAIAHAIDARDRSAVPPHPGAVGRALP